MEGLGMLVLEKDGPHDLSRIILLPMCSQEEAHVFADVHRQDKDVSKRMSEMKSYINRAHRYKKKPLEAVKAELDEVDLADLAEAEAVSADIEKRKAERPPTQHRYAWYPWIQGVAVIKWETKDDDEEDEEDYG